MAYAGTARVDAARRPPRSGPPPTRMRWDRLGRAAMLLVMCVLLYLYISPVRSLISTVGESARRHAEVSSLTRANERLRAERAALSTPAALVRTARGLGLVRPGEREFVVSGLPPN
jgi:hypothetical protein